MKTVYPPQTKFAGGIIMTAKITRKLYNLWCENYKTCSDPESSVRGGATLKGFLFCFSFSR